MGVYRENWSKSKNLYKEKKSIRGRFILYVFFFEFFYQSDFSQIVNDDYFICLKYLSNVYFAPSAFLFLFHSINT